VRVGVSPQEKWGIQRRQEEEFSLDFSASRQPKILTLCSSLEGKLYTFSRPKNAQTFICQYF